MKSAISPLGAVKTVLVRDIKKVNAVQGHRIREDRRDLRNNYKEDRRGNDLLYSYLPPMT